MVSRKKYENEEHEILPEKAKQVPTGVFQTNLSYWVLLFRSTHSFKYNFIIYYYNLSLACSPNGSRSWSQ